MKRIFTFLILFNIALPANPCMGQYFNETSAFRKANSIWMLEKNGVDFNSQPPSIFPTGLSFNGHGENWVSVSDRITGELLFYSNGSIAFNRNHKVMPYGFGLGSFGQNTQNACIVPYVGEPDKYYLFTVPGLGVSGGAGVAPPPPPGGGQTGDLRYSVIDMTLDQGLGAVVENKKNMLLNAGSFSPVLIAVPGNNCDIWLLVHVIEEATFKAFRITRRGIDTTPVVSILSNAITGPGSYKGGALAVSPNRSLLGIASNFGMNDMYYGVALPGFCGFQIAKFDPNTGVVSDNLILSDNSNALGVCFSPDNSKVYFTTYQSSWQSPNCGYISQYDITNYNQAAIVATKYDIPDVGGLLRRQGDTIYTSTLAAYITNPNASGAACNFQFNPLVSNLGNSLGYSIGNDVVFPKPPDTFLLDPLDTCFMEKIVLKAPPGYQNYVWQDGTRDSMMLAYESGTYQVTYDDDCHTYIMTIHAEELAEGLGTDTTVCGAGPIRLEPEIFGLQPATYTWSDGSSGPYINVSASGTYWVQLQFEGGCSFTDTIQVRLIDVKQDLGADIQICYGDPINLTLQANTIPGASIIWSTGERTEQIVAIDTGAYWMEVSAPPCSGSDTLFINPVYCGCKTLTPSAFSPNGDGVNDYFKPVVESGCPVANYALSIYNRFGQRVFYSTSPSKGWDGRINGNMGELGVYFYEVHFDGGSSGNQREYHRQGDLMLLR